VRFSKGLGEKGPSYGTVSNIIRSLGADLVTLAHEGTKAYSNIFELVHRREADGPNATWQADHTPLDILLVRSDGEVAKPWLSVVIDDYSRCRTVLKSVLTQLWCSLGTCGTFAGIDDKSVISRKSLLRSEQRDASPRVQHGPGLDYGSSRSELCCLSWLPIHLALAP
jgi:hypothetical protein